MTNNKGIQNGKVFLTAPFPSGVPNTNYFGTHHLISPMYFSYSLYMLIYCNSMDPTYVAVSPTSHTDDFDKINLNRELKHKITCSRKDFTK
jgi:hypothetical protein